MQFEWRDGDSYDDSDEDFGGVRLMHHDARWRQEFQQTRSGILQCCEGRVTEVEHVGATAVGGLIARPIIDAVAVVADPVDLADSAMLIEGLNFRPVKLDGWALQNTPAEGLTAAKCLQKPRHGDPTHRVYLVGQGSHLLSEMLQLRDFLRRAPEHVIEFEEVKLRVWRDMDGDRDAYAAKMASEFDSLQRTIG